MGAHIWSKGYQAAKVEASIFEDLYKDYRHLHGVGRAEQVQFIVIG